MKNEKEIKG